LDSVRTNHHRWSGTITNNQSGDGMSPPRRSTISLVVLLSMGSGASVGLGTGVGAQIPQVVTCADSSLQASAALCAGSHGGVPAIQVQSFEFGSQSPTGATNGTPTGQRTHSPITVTKEAGAATPQLLQGLATGEGFKTVPAGGIPQGTDTTDTAAAGKGQHGPISFSKELGVSSPQTLQAHWTSEVPTTAQATGTTPPPAPCPNGKPRNANGTCPPSN
jgi:type VI protein secretion system component Hcp